jgi:hypothetical protein
MFAAHRYGHLVSELGKVRGDAVGHLAIFGMPPGMIDHIEIGSIDR